MANTLLTNWKLNSEIIGRLLAALSVLKKYGRMEVEVIVTNRGLTEDIRDRDMWINLVLNEGRPLYSGQPLDKGVKLCVLYSECSSGVQTVSALRMHLRLLRSE